MLRIARIIIECTTPLHCGGGISEQYDQPVTRDAFGFYRIPGSTIAGVLRAFTRQRFSAKLADEAFGTQAGELSSSLIWCSDGELLDFDGARACHKHIEGKDVDFLCGPFIRDHVRIDLERGAAEIGGKYDEEIVPPGTRFALQISLDGWMTAPPDAMLKLFDALVEAMQNGLIHFGGKAASGYGRFRVLQLESREFDLGTEQGMAAYLNLSTGPGFDIGEGVSWAPVPGKIVFPGDGISGHLELPLVSHGPLLIGSGEASGDADISFMQVPIADYAAAKILRRFVVPGSSFRGVVRHRVYHIAGALGVSRDEAENLIDALFGTASLGLHGGESDDRPGKLAFFDALLPDCTPTTVQHVAIDRFSGGALEGALFDEAPLWVDGLGLTLRVEGRGLRPCEAALLLHALTDLAEGSLPVGGGCNRGNGVLMLRGLQAGGLGSCLSSVQSHLQWDGEIFSPDDFASRSTWISRLEAAQREEWS